MRFTLLAILAAGVPAIALHAQAPAPAPTVAAEAPVAAGEGRTVALKLADSLVASFVFRSQADDYAAMLRKNAAAGRYDQGKRGEIASRITDDLMAVHKDGHLKVNVSEPQARTGGRGGGGGIPRNWPPLIQSAKTIAPGVGYIRFTAFLGTDEEIARVRTWLAENRNARTLIFDLRNHHGGGLDEQDAIFSYLYAEKTPLVRMAMAKSVYEERGSPIEPGPTLTFAPEGDKMAATHMAIPGEDTPLRKAKVYLLVSNKSASAAEHFALALKSTGRATLIGEATAGANHFGGTMPLTDNFNVWMPIGRTYDVKTGKDWEGAGIAPDVEVDPKQALVFALEKAGLSHEEAVRLNSKEVPGEPVHSDKLRAR